MDEESFRLLADEPHVALERIVMRHGAQLRKRIELYVRDDEELVKDVLSETLIAIWTDREKVACMKDPFAWTMAVAKNLALYRIRGAYRHIKVSVEGIHHLADGLQADTDLHYKELRERLLQATEGLTHKEREVVIDAKLHEMNNKELAEAHDVTVQRAKNILSSAMKKLRQLLRDISE